MRPFRRDAGLPHRRLCLHDPGAAAGDGQGRLRSAHFRPEALCGARQVNPGRAGGARHRPGGGPHRDCGGDGQPAEGQPRRRAPDRHARHQRPAFRRAPGSATSSSPGATARRFGSATSPRSVDGVQNERTGAWFEGKPAEGLAIQREAGANTIQVVDTIKALLPQSAAVDPAVGACRSGVRPLAGDPRRGARRAVHDDADGRAGGPGHLHLSAHAVGDGDPEPGRAAVAARDLRGHVRARLQPRQHLADGADDLGRVRRRRRDRHDREHRALSRKGRAARSRRR